MKRTITTSINYIKDGDGLIKLAPDFGSDPTTGTWKIFFPIGKYFPCT